MGLYVSQKIEIWTPIWDPHGLPIASKIDPGALKITIFDLPGSVYDSGDDFWGQKNGKKWKTAPKDAECGGLYRPLGGRIHRMGGAQHASILKFSL